MIDFFKRRYANESGHGLRAAIILDVILAVIVTTAIARYGWLLADVFF